MFVIDGYSLVILTMILFQLKFLVTTFRLIVLANSAVGGLCV